MSKGWGGEREGAGRNPKIDDPTRFQMAWDYHERIWLDFEAHTVRRANVATERAGLNDLWEQLNSLPPELRARMVALADNTDATATDDDVRVSDAADSLRLVRAILDGRSFGQYKNSKPYGRWSGFPRRLPKGAKGRIQRDLAKEYSKKLKTLVTQDYIRRCVAEFRPWFEREQSK